MAMRPSTLPSEVNCVTTVHPEGAVTVGVVFEIATVAIIRSPDTTPEGRFRVYDEVEDVIDVHLVAAPTNAIGGTTDGGAMFATDAPPDTLSR
jgi:hypothetical protein